MKVAGYFIAGVIGGILGLIWTTVIFVLGTAFGFKIGQPSKTDRSQSKIHEVH